MDNLIGEKSIKAELDKNVLNLKEFFQLHFFLDNFLFDTTSVD